MIFRAIARMGKEPGFCQGEQGIRSLCRSLAAVVSKGIGDDEEEGYYSSTQDESEVAEDTARRGLSEAGSMTIADSIWNKCVPRGLLSKYKRHLRRTEVADSGKGKKVEILACMMEDVRETTRGIKHTRRPPPRSSYVRNRRRSAGCYSTRRTCTRRTTGGR